MAHLAVAFFAFALLAVVLTNPAWLSWLFAFPIALSALIIRFRTVADAQGFTARSAFGSTTVSWDDVAGLRFGKGLWAYARRGDGSEVQLPAVTFSTLPLLTEASGGRVPNPYA
jgi:hypothetical protein